MRVGAGTLQERRGPSTPDLELREAGFVEEHRAMRDTRVPRRQSQDSNAHPPSRGRSSSTASASPRQALGSNQFGRSQELFSPNAQPNAARRSYAAERRRGRPDRRSRLGSGCRNASSTPRLGDGQVAARVVRTEAADVHAPHVKSGSPVQHPLGHHLADTSSTGDPWAQNPAATNRPRSAVSPRMNSLSGVEAFQAFTRWRIDPLHGGTQEQALAMSGANRSQSSGSNRPLKSPGTPSTAHGAGCRS